MNTKTIRAIHINPFDKTVTLIQAPKDFNAMKREVLHCSMGEVMDFGEGVDAWFDEEGMLKNWDEQAFTKFLGELTLAGHVLLCGQDDDGYMGDLPGHIDVETVRGLLEFIDPQEVAVPGPTLTTQDPETGAVKVEHLGPAMLTYDNH